VLACLPKRRPLSLGPPANFHYGLQLPESARTAVLVGGPIAKHGSPIAPELGDMGR
jgi:hypothetical protein